MTKAANEAKNIKPALIYRCQSMAHGSDMDFQLKMATLPTNLGEHKPNKVIDTQLLTTYCHTC